MKKTLFLSALLFCAMAFVSCNKEGEYQEFATKFANAVYNKDTLALKDMIQDGKAISFDGFEINPVNAADVQLEELGDNGYRVNFGQQRMIVRKTDDYGLQVCEATGIFSCANDRLVAFAKKRGLLKSDDEIECLKVLNSQELKAQYKKMMERRAVKGLDEKVNTFYSKSIKAIPILPSFTEPFANIMRNCQARAGWNGIKGYICYCFWGNWTNGSEETVENFSASCGTAVATGKEEATIPVTLTMIVDTPMGTDHRTFNDVFHFRKVGGEWKIDDIVRNGTSLKEFHRSNTPCPA